MIIQPSAVYEGHYSFCHNPQQSARMYVLNENNHIFEIMPDYSLREAGALHLLTKKKQISYMAFHPSQEHTVFLTEEGMAAADFAENILWKHAGDIVALLYAPNGNSVWLCERADKTHLKITLHDANNGTLLSECLFEDTLYESSVSFQNLPQGEGVLMQLAAGQDGVSVFLLTFEEGIQTRELFPKCCNIMPTFSPDMTRLLTLENDEMLYYTYTWQELEPLAQQRDFTEEEWEDEEVSPGYEMLCLSNDLAITQSANYRYYLFDLVKMKRLEEVIIEGFEPLPTREVFPRLDDDTLYSTVVLFCRQGQFLVAKTDTRAKTQALMIFDETGLF